jgi:hypothetical protein
MGSMSLGASKQGSRQARHMTRTAGDDKCTQGEISGSRGDGYEVLGEVDPCSQVEIDRCFRGVYCLHHQGTVS